jgi:hypothetical protein
MHFLVSRVELRRMRSRAGFRRNSPSMLQAKRTHGPTREAHRSAGEGY